MTQQYFLPFVRLKMMLATILCRRKKVAVLQNNILFNEINQYNNTPYTVFEEICTLIYILKTLFMFTYKLRNRNNHSLHNGHGYT